MPLSKKSHLDKIYFAKVQATLIFISSLLFAFFIRFELAPILLDKLPLALFIINAMIIAYLFGLVAGFSALFIGGILSYYFFVPPYSSWDMPDYYHIVYFSAKFFLGSLLILITIWTKDQIKEMWGHH
jgi:K+-sensing histidine kinase KdpD